MNGGLCKREVSVERERERKKERKKINYGHVGNVTMPCVSHCIASCRYCVCPNVEVFQPMNESHGREGKVATITLVAITKDDGSNDPYDDLFVAVRKNLLGKRVFFLSLSLSLSFSSFATCS